MSDLLSKLKPVILKLNIVGFFNCWLVSYVIKNFILQLA